MNTKILKLVRKHFVHDGVSTHISRHNQRAWVRSVRMLGDKWLLAKSISLGERA